MKIDLARWRILAADVLFPVFCAGCGQEGQWWCAPCRAAAPLAVPACPGCRAPSSWGVACGACRDASVLEGLVAPLAYEDESPVGRLIKQFKYHYVADMAAVWSSVWRDYRAVHPFPPGSIVPVPLHPRRRRERGFNQAERIAESIDPGLILESGGLVRVRYTSQQARLARADREANVAGAFEWQSEEPVPEEVVVVDDVFTTGATLRECARILRQHGARRVWGAVLARGL